jgi:hypothetical protein
VADHHARGESGAVFQTPPSGPAGPDGTSHAPPFRDTATVQGMRMGTDAATGS